jgi:hypothetical protein
VRVFAACFENLRRWWRWQGVGHLSWVNATSTCRGRRSRSLRHGRQRRSGMVLRVLSIVLLLRIGRRRRGTSKR